MKPTILNILAVVLVAFGFAFVSAETGSADQLASLAFSPLPGSATLVQPAKCVVKNNQLVCDIPTKKKKKHGNEEVEDQPEKKGKEKEDTGLENCTIISKQGGGGCKTGFKFICEKMKSGKKCCGCVEDKKAKKDEPKKDEPKKDDAKDEKKEEPKVKLWSCTGPIRNPASNNVAAKTIQVPGNNEGAAQNAFIGASGGVPAGPIACTPAN